MFWEKSRQRTNHQRGKTEEENTTLMIGIGPATNTDLVLYCTVLYLEGEMLGLRCRTGLFCFLKVLELMVRPELES